MKHFIVYDSDGVILRSGYCSDDLFEYQRESDELIMEGEAKPGKHKVLDGEVVEVEEVIDKEREFNIAFYELIDKRNATLKETDWTQMPDSPLPVSEKQKWAEYRQDLRDYGNNLANVRVREAKYLREITFPRTPKNKNAEVTTIDEN
ncbi:phage tail assembly chaperone [bacterium]|nr:phage tail assembly chaperone [bacterium]MDA7760495.1 phage tail assembly chaperone [bacterium]